MLILVFTTLILCVSVLIAIPLALDEELRENMKFWGIVVAALLTPYLILEYVR
jgi:ABC-type sugar transport system permease subunit